MFDDNLLDWLSYSLVGCLIDSLFRNLTPPFLSTNNPAINPSKPTQPGDVLIDGGNEWFPNSVRRAEALAPKGAYVDR